MRLYLFFIIVALLLYSFFSFIMWELNPACWNIFMRVLYLIVLNITFLYIFTQVKKLKNKKDADNS